MDIVRKQCEVHYYRGIGIISLPQLQLHRTNIERTLNKKNYTIMVVWSSHRLELHHASAADSVLSLLLLPLLFRFNWLQVPTWSIVNEIVRKKLNNWKCINKNCYSLLMSDELTTAITSHTLYFVCQSKKKQHEIDALDFADILFFDIPFNHSTVDMEKEKNKAYSITYINTRKMIYSVLFAIWHELCNWIQY